ncbi:hypothetical protein [Planctomicrobium sp. SH527]|uniref:hypothetical protein n=1 Tax=Planctomicrobium sp. SH527 TaxID=3448123 RepID=UPI003F5C9915
MKPTELRDSPRPKTREENFVSDSDCTDIEIAPDGRIFLFGASTQAMELLEACGLHDPASRTRMGSPELPESISSEKQDVMNVEMTDPAT